MSVSLVFDTDVLIDFLRGLPSAVSYVQEASGRQIISAITVAELYSGVREGLERDLLEGLLQQFEIVPLTEKTAVVAGLFRRTYLKSHKIGIADVVIAATAKIEGARVVTLNRKHYPMFSNVLVPYVKV